MMPAPFLLEACCQTATGAIAAAKAGADRIELNSALSLGGLTPSGGLLTTVKAETSVPVLSMIRPREGGFAYDPSEFRCMLRDAESLLSLGADGIVFGCLTPEGTVDAERTSALCALCEGRETVFHRAIDLVPDWRRALDTLISLGVTRVLTSGQAPTAMEGTETLAAMREFVSGAIQILPASGIRPENAATLISRTGLTCVHLSASCIRHDVSWPRETPLWFSSPGLPDGGCYTDTDPEIIARTRSVLECCARAHKA